jgi:crossover junction endodeoxyribonuclease RuvC
MQTRIMGIDPGVSGAVAIFEGTNLLDAFDMPVVETQSGKRKKRRISPEMLVAEIEEHIDHLSRVYIEDVHAMPGQGVTSMFAFGEAAGLIRGVCAGLKVPVHLISPVTWKRGLKLQGAGKDASRAMAARIWPQKAGLFKRQRDDGRAEAALLAHYGQTHTPVG